MEVKMSIRSRKEILCYTKKRYEKASSKDKSKIIDEFVSVTGYLRKYAIHLLNKKDRLDRHCGGNTKTTGENNNGTKVIRRTNKRKYDESLKAALLTIWYSANQICSKRLVPFIPDLLTVLERFGHIALPLDIRSKLLQVSPATVDRLLETPRRESRGGISTTRPGSLLKKQIKIRTFADWNDVIPGFFEGDLVAHCGDRVDGAFLNTLVLTDIASSWTEFFPLIKKGAADVIASLEVLQQMLPFTLLGLDTDNGSEFINYALLDFCKTNKITFTRSRAYKKNDQAHVEEKNGSIVRRLVGYDRFEGIDAYNALSELYATLRLYVNFFQPSLKLISKKRDGAKVTKKYDKAKTPYQRLLISTHIPAEAKTTLKNQYEQLDPVLLLNDLQRLQDNFWKYAWKEQVQSAATTTQNVTAEINTKTCTPINEATLSQIHECVTNHGAINVGIEPNTNTMSITNTKSSTTKATNHIVNLEHRSDNKLLLEDNLSQANKRLYRHTKKPRKKLAPRTWRTRPDPFESVSHKLRLQLELNPGCRATSLLDDLIKESPEKFNAGHIRTLQTRIAEWRKEQIKINQERYSQNVLTENNMINKYISLVAHSVTGG